MVKRDFSQNEPFTIKGHWWLPESNRKVAGDLIYREESLTLELYGGLNDALAKSPLSAVPEANEFPLVLGESLDEMPITVLRSFYTQWAPASVPLPFRPGTPSGVRSSKLSCHIAILGIHLQSPTDGFAQRCIEIPCLENWLGDEPFDIRFNDDSFDNIQVSYDRPKDEKYEIKGHFSLIPTVKKRQSGVFGLKTGL